MTFSEELLVAANQLRETIQLDLRGLPKEKQAMVAYQLNKIDQRMENAARLLEIAARIIQK